MMVRVELMDTTRVLLEEISSDEMSKKDVALSYRLAIASSDDTDWKTVNAAIRERWSKTTLMTIKEWAWNGIPDGRGGKT